MTIHDTKTGYLISLIELQLNRRGYYIQREVQSGNRQLDALAESTEASAKANSLPIRFAIEYKVVKAGSSPHFERRVKSESVPWRGSEIEMFWIYLYPLERVVRVPNVLRQMIKSEQSMIVKSA
jgi:hypothetical protein